METMPIDRRTIIVLLIIACLLHAWPLWQWEHSPHRNPVEFVVHKPYVPTNDDSPQKIEEFIGSAPEEGIVQVASICESLDGKLAAVWYSGSRVGAKDVKIFFTSCVPERGIPWSKPRVLVSRETASKELNRYVKKVGNPVIFSDLKGEMWLIYVTISIGGWSCSSLNVKTSNDGGITWTPSRRIPLSPFYNVSELVKNKPLSLKDGGLMLPIYHECLGKFPEMLHIRRHPSKQGIAWLKARITGGRSFIQPAMVALGPSSAAVFLRSCLEERAVTRAVTTNGGNTWSETLTLDLPNPDSGLDALLLPDGRILLVFNDSKDNRENLTLAISSDDGINWTRVATLECTPYARYSYPYIILDQKERVHLVYTWRDKRIKHVIINKSWINKKIEDLEAQ